PCSKRFPLTMLIEDEGPLPFLRGSRRKVKVPKTQKTGSVRKNEAQSDSGTTKSATFTFEKGIAHDYICQILPKNPTPIPLNIKRFCQTLFGKTVVLINLGIDLWL